MVKMSPVKRKNSLIYAVFALMAASSIIAGGCGGGGAKKTDSTEDLGAILAKGVKPNEMGMVMILEYHRIQENEGDYTRSIENFSKDMETLYQKGYRLVKFHDLASGRMNVPVNTTPIVLSFDDSTEGQFRYIKEGSKTVIDPDCALGMMEAAHKKHPDFGLAALFNFLPELFDQPKYKKTKVDYLYNNGFELGDHTVTHPQLSKESDDNVQKEIGQPLKDMKKINPNIKIDVLCLPHGLTPKNEKLMYDGSYEGKKYHMNWALLVGSNPMYPEYHYRNPGKVLPRVQVMDYDPEDGSGASCSDYWLRYFDKHPELRYISDGDPNTICAPSYMNSRLLQNKLPSGVHFLGY